MHDNPLVFRVQDEQRFEEMASICSENDWQFIGGIEPDKPEDIVEVEYLLNPEAFRKPPKMRRSNVQTYVNTEPKVGRNDPCICGSGKKYKKCCLNK